MSHAVSHLRLKKQPPLRGAVVLRRQPAGHAPNELLGLGLGLLVHDNVRRVGLLPCGAHTKRLHRAHEPARCAIQQMRSEDLPPLERRGDADGLALSLFA